MTEDTTTDLETLNAKCEEYLAGWKRAQADYANLVKEAEKRRLELSQYATERCLMKLLPAIDQFEVALQHVPSLDGVPEADRAKFANWITGLEAVRSLWNATAKEMGLESVNTDGHLDPTVHEAVAEEASDSVPAGDVIRTIQNGWRLHERLLRPAKVVVSKGPNHDIRN